jgi:PKD repeat protein
MSDIKQDVKATVKVFVQMLVSIIVRESTKKMIKKLSERQRKKFEDKIKDMSDDQLTNYFSTNHYFKNALETTIKATIKVQSAENTLSLMGKLQSIFEDTSYLKSPVSALVWPAPKVIITLVAGTAKLATAAVPLAVIVSQDTPNLPAANFSSNVTSGFAPLSVRFTDLSKNATEWEWEFGDGHNSTQSNPTHTYSVAGEYNVKLIAKNENGTDSKSGKITVLEKQALLLPIADFSSSTTMG